MRKLAADHGVAKHATMDERSRKNCIHAAADNSPLKIRGPSDAGALVVAVRAWHQERYGGADKAADVVGPFQCSSARDLKGPAQCPSLRRATGVAAYNVTWAESVGDPRRTSGPSLLQYRIVLSRAQG